MSENDRPEGIEPDEWEEILARRQAKQKKQTELAAVESQGVQFILSENNSPKRSPGAEVQIRSTFGETAMGKIIEQLSPLIFRVRLFDNLEVIAHETECQWYGPAGDHRPE